MTSAMMRKKYSMKFFLLILSSIHCSTNSCYYQRIGINLQSKHELQTSNTNFLVDCLLHCTHLTDCMFAYIKDGSCFQYRDDLMITNIPVQATVYKKDCSLMTTATTTTMPATTTITMPKTTSPVTTTLTTTTPATTTPTTTTPTTTTPKTATSTITTPTTITKTSTTTTPMKTTQTTTTPKTTTPTTTTLLEAVTTTENTIGIRCSFYYGGKDCSQTKDLKTMLNDECSNWEVSSVPLFDGLELPFQWCCYHTGTLKNDQKFYVTGIRYINKMDVFKRIIDNHPDVIDSYYIAGNGQSCFSVCKNFNRPCLEKINTLDSTYLFSREGIDCKVNKEGKESYWQTDIEPYFSTVNQYRYGFINPQFSSCFDTNPPNHVRRLCRCEK